MRVRPHVILLWVLVGALALLAVLLAAPAFAATTIGPQAWQRYSGTRIVAGPFPTLEACATGAADGNTCRVSVRITVTSDCPPQPAAETRTQICPSGTTGSWIQSRAYVTAPAPACWIAGPWIPQEAPIGACVEPPPPPPTGDWTHCAEQDGYCGQPDTPPREIRFGSVSRNVWSTPRILPGSVLCNATVFGNPIRGELKTCQQRGVQTTPLPVDPPPPPATGTATLHWTPPATMTDGTPAMLAGFRVRYGRSADALDRSIEVADAGSTSATVDSLASGTWYFAVTAYDAQGRESYPSNVATKVVQ